MKILIPRRSGEERERRWIQEIYRKIQDYIKNGSRGNLNLSDTPIKILPNNLKRVYGALWLNYSKIENLNNLEYVSEDLHLTGSKLMKSFPDNLKRIDGSLCLISSNIEDLNNLEYVGGYLDLRYTPLSKITNEKEIRSKIKINTNIVCV